MRYDAYWRHNSPSPGQDRGYWMGWGRAGAPRPHPMSHAPDLEFEMEGSQGIYGPARYGLGPYHERLRRRKRSDEELREEVEDALFYDTWVDADAISVEVQAGVVTLRGELPTYEEVRFATDDAWDVEGVRGVRPELRVRES